MESAYTIDDLDGIVPPYLLRRARRQAELMGVRLKGTEGTRSRSSFAYHRGSVSFEGDHARDLDLRRRGFTVLRFTGTQIENQPDRVVADVTAALSR
ncbi:MAG: DUF559 domain-containing protein [Solirubrobacterales bacterium]